MLERESTTRNALCKRIEISPARSTTTTATEPSSLASGPGNVHMNGSSHPLDIVGLGDCVVGIISIREGHKTETSGAA
jgi:hypothetical protein